MIAASGVLCCPAAVVQRGAPNPVACTGAPTCHQWPFFIQAGAPRVLHRPPTKHSPGLPNLQAQTGETVVLGVNEISSALRRQYGNDMVPEHLGDVLRWAAIVLSLQFVPLALRCASLLQAYTHLSSAMVALELLAGQQVDPVGMQICTCQHAGQAGHCSTMSSRPIRLHIQPATVCAYSTTTSLNHAHAL